MTPESSVQSETEPQIKVTSGPTPSDEELAAILAAVQVVVLSGSDGAVPAAPQPSLRWRFSGRWWAKPVPSRRERPAVF